MRAFGHSALASDFVAVDVFPGFDRRERNLVRSQTDDFAILVVHFLGPFVLESAAAVEAEGDFRGGR